MRNSIFNFKKVQHHLRFSFIIMFVFLFGQTQYGQIQTQISGGLAAGYSPQFNFEETESRTHEGKGNTYSLFGELIIEDKFIARFQFVNLIVPTYSGDFENRIKSGRSFTGSFGYVLGKPSSKFRFPVMGSAGAGIINYSNFTNGGFQLGVTAGPQYRITKHVHAVADLRYLKGFSTSGASGPISQIDFLVGLKFSF